MSIMGSFCCCRIPPTHQVQPGQTCHSVDLQKGEDAERESAFHSRALSCLCVERPERTARRQTSLLLSLLPLFTEREREREGGPSAPTLPLEPPSMEYFTSLSLYNFLFRREGYA